MAVIDASIAVAWLIDHPLSPGARPWMDAENQAPSLILAEVANTLWKYVTVRDLPIRDALDAVRDIREYFRDRLIPDVGLLEQALEIGAEIRRPVYDCLYLTLALERGDVLVTADRQLASAAGRVNVAVELVEPEG